MALFRYKSDGKFQPGHVDFFFLRDGPLFDYCNDAALNRDIQSLKKLGYFIVDIDTKGSAIFYDVLETVAKKLKLPPVASNHPSDFREYMTNTEYLKRAGVKSGLLIILRNFDTIYTKDKEFCKVFLSIFHYISKVLLLFGVKFLVFLQHNDAKYKIEPLQIYIHEQRLPTRIWKPKKDSSAKSHRKPLKKDGK